MGRGGVHGLTTGHLDDVGFINIQPVIKATGIERREKPERGEEIAKEREAGTSKGRTGRVVQREGKKEELYKSRST